MQQLQHEPILQNLPQTFRSNWDAVDVATSPQLSRSFLVCNNYPGKLRWNLKMRPWKKRQTIYIHTIYFIGSYSIPYFLRMYSVLFLGVHRGMSRSVFPKPYWLKHPAVRTRIAPQSPSLKWPLGRDQPEIQKLCSIIDSIYIYTYYIYIYIDACYIYIYV